MDLIRLNEVKEREIVPGAKARFIHSGNMTFAYWHIDAGASIPEHAHSHEQVVNMIEGELKLTLDGETETLGPGAIVIIPPDAVHGVEVITDSRVLDVFYPVREDYR